jgi:hypothetical protein
MKRQTENILIGIVFLFVLFLGLYLAFSDPVAEISYHPIDVGGGSITVEDQDQLDRVFLSAELVAPGFITIHESMGGAPAAIIATSDYLEVGMYEELELVLDIQMTPGYRYITLLHADNGDTVYVTNDDLPVMVNEEVIRPDFVAIPSAVEILPPTE